MKRMPRLGPTRGCLAVTIRRSRSRRRRCRLQTAKLADWRHASPQNLIMYIQYKTDRARPRTWTTGRLQEGKGGSSRLMDVDVDV
jgi:hypothetical protein